MRQLRLELSWQIADAGLWLRLPPNRCPHNWRISLIAGISRGIAWLTRKSLEQTHAWMVAIR